MFTRSGKVYLTRNTSCQQAFFPKVGRESCGEQHNTNTSSNFLWKSSLFLQRNQCANFCHTHPFKSGRYLDERSSWRAKLDVLIWLASASTLDYGSTCISPSHSVTLARLDSCRGSIRKRNSCISVPRTAVNHRRMARLGN